MSVTVHTFYSKRLKKNTFGYTVEVTVNGERKYECKRGFAGKTEARNAGRLVESTFKKQISENGDLDELIKKDKSKLKLYDLLDLWLNSKKLNVKQTTFESYTNNAKMIKNVFKNDYIKKINPELIEAKLNSLVGTHIKNGKKVNKNKEISPTTIRHYYNTLHMAFEFAAGRHYLKTNPCAKINRPKKEKKEMQYYNTEEIAKLLTGITEYSSYIPVLLALGTGMREGEIAALTWGDVDFKNGFINVNKQLQKIEGHLKVLPPKSDSSFRYIAINEDVIEPLKAHKAKQEEVIPNLKYVCSNSDGRPYDPDTLGSNYRRLMKVYNLCDRLGLKYIRFHDLRHSHATFLIANHVSDKIISERLGHSDVKVTLNTYSHVNNILQKDALKNIKLPKE